MMSTCHHSSTTDLERDRLDWDRDEMCLRRGDLERRGDGERDLCTRNGDVTLVLQAREQPPQDI